MICKKDGLKAKCECETGFKLRADKTICEKGKFTESHIIYRG